MTKKSSSLTTRLIKSLLVRTTTYTMLKKRRPLLSSVKATRLITKPLINDGVDSEPEVDGGHEDFNGKMNHQATLRVL